ncbi:MAG: hypothetical protein H6576_09760 [Lewinellaceae bacterium]|nr:hypothetical protein [Lewinellaceae bacterium]
MTAEQITSIGLLLSSYKNDLNYFANFIRFSKGEISSKDYAAKAPGSFKNFIDDFRVARSTQKDLTPVLLDCALEWYQKGETKDVDGFTLLIQDKKLTHDKRATSLASKIMFLMNPWEVMPLDALVKAALKHRTNDYTRFRIKWEAFKQKEQEVITYNVGKVSGMLEVIERPFVGRISDLAKIRENRFLDKWLWVKGQRELPNQRNH